MVQVMLAESPAQLTLEAAAAKQWGSVNPPAKTAEPASVPPPPPPPVVAVNGALGAEGAPKVAATEATSIPNGGGLVTSAPAKVIPSPVKQTEYRRPDGRRRIIPEPLGPPAGHEGLFGNGVMHDAQPEIPNVPTSDFEKTVDKKREDPVKAVVAKESDAENKRSLPEECTRGVDVPAAKRSNNNTAFSETGAATPAAPAAHPSSAPEAFVVGINSNPPASIAMVQQADMITSLERISSVKGVLSIRTQAPEDAVIQAPITLESRPIESSDNSGSIVGAGGTTLKRESLAKAEVVCSQAGVVRWRDRLSSIPTALAGNFNFWAVACSDGTLQVLAFPLQVHLELNLILSPNLSVASLYPAFCLSASDSV
jgi:protein HIRA/HIR1